MDSVGKVFLLNVSVIADMKKEREDFYEHDLQALVLHKPKMHRFCFLNCILSLYGK